MVIRRLGAAVSFVVFAAACSPSSPPPQPLPKVAPARRFYGKVAEVYRLADEHAAVLAQLHCYCGCEQHEDHHHLLDCFTTSHGSSCEICMNEVRDTDQMLRDGLSVEEIGAALQRKYGALAREEPEGDEPENTEESGEPGS